MLVEVKTPQKPEANNLGAEGEPLGVALARKINDLSEQNGHDYREFGDVDVSLGDTVYHSGAVLFRPYRSSDVEEVGHLYLMNQKTGVRFQFRGDGRTSETITTQSGDSVHGLHSESETTGALVSLLEQLQAKHDKNYNDIMDAAKDIAHFSGVDKMGWHALPETSHEPVTEGGEIPYMQRGVVSLMKGLKIPVDGIPGNDFYDSIQITLDIPSSKSELEVMPDSHALASIHFRGPQVAQTIFLEKDNRVEVTRQKGPNRWTEKYKPDERVLGKIRLLMYEARVQTEALKHRKKQDLGQMAVKHVA